MTGILIEWVPTDEWGRTDGEWTVVRTVAEAAEALGPYPWGGMIRRRRHCWEYSWHWEYSWGCGWHADPEAAVAAVAASGAEQ